MAVKCGQKPEFGPGFVERNRGRRGRVVEMLEPEVGKPPVALFGRTAWRALLRSDESGTEDVVGRAGHVYYML